MRVDALAIVLRPRSMAESADLGAALVRAWARSVWRVFLPAYLAVVVAALALCVATRSDWLPWLLIFLLKPWLDRSLLFVLARAVFGEPTRVADLWRARRKVWGGDLLRTLFWLRFSPWRSYTLPIEQLEGSRGATRSRRRSQLLRGRRGAALSLQIAFAHVEAALCCGLLAVGMWLTPGDGDAFWTWLFKSHSLSGCLLQIGIYAVVVGVLEPFYVAAGFAMYLNRRVELEAWDIEQTFRAAFTPRNEDADAAPHARGEAAA